MGKKGKPGCGLLPWLALGGASAVFALSLAPFLGSGPARFATHFDGAGRPNGWMPPGGYALFMGATGFGVALFVAGLGYAIRFFPASMLNVPNAAHWRSPEHYPRACALFFARMLWFAAMNLAWLAVLNWQVAEANARTPPSLEGAPMALTTGVYLAAVAFWVISLLLPFFKIQPPDGTRA